MERSLNGDAEARHAGASTLALDEYQAFPLARKLVLGFARRDRAALVGEEHVECPPGIGTEIALSPAAISPARAAQPPTMR